MSTFKGKVALVTGGGSGLGEVIAKDLAGIGANVVVTDIDLESAERVTEEIRSAGGEASPIRQDTAQSKDSVTPSRPSGPRITP